jgi:hypothetical protein
MCNCIVHTRFTHQYFNDFRANGSCNAKLDCKPQPAYKVKICFQYNPVTRCCKFHHKMDIIDTHIQVFTLLKLDNCLMIYYCVS